MQSGTQAGVPKIGVQGGRAERAGVVAYSGTESMSTSSRNQALLRVRNGVLRRLHAFEPYRSWILRRAQVLYYEDGREGRTWRDTYFLGVPLRKNPLDLWIYQELLSELRPDLIVETGTLFGGSAYFLARMCDLLEHGSIVSVDIKERPDRPQHPRVTYLTGSSTSPGIVAEVSRRAAESERVLIVLDSDHRRDHVLAELRAYAPLVTTGSYLIVEDTNVNGHPVWSDFGPGPMEAVEAFLAEAPEFEVDTAREKFLFSANPRGYLRRNPSPT
jgi:cephalosporin hydroxylase